MWVIPPTIDTGTFLGRIPFARFGAGPDPVLVVAGGQAFVQRSTHERVARDARRIARLLPPGRSFIRVGYDPTPVDFSLATLSRDLGVVLGELGGNVAMMGISYGGIVAMRAAADHPTRVARLVLLASAHDFSTEGKQRVQRQIDCASRGDLVALTEQFVAMFRRPWLNALVRVRLRIGRARLAARLNDPALIVRGLRAVLDDPVDIARLASLAAPCLLVAGSRDQFFGDGMVERTAAAIPRATVEVIAGETHMVPVERPGRVARALHAFLR